MNTLGVREMARNLGCSPALVSKLRAAGMPMHSAAAAQAWREQNTRTRAHSSKAPTVAPDEGGFAHWRARREKALALQAERAELLQRGELVSVEAIGREWAKLLTDFKTRLLGLPARMAPLLENKSAREVDALLADAVWHELNELSGGGDHAAR